MGVIASMFERAEKRVSLANPDRWLTSVFGGEETSSGIPVDESKALQLSAVYACVRVLSETLASLPLPVYRRLTPRGKARAPDHSLFEILHDRANPDMTSVTFRETLMAHVVLWGNGYAEIERDRAGRVISLWPLLPDRTWPVRKDKILRYITRVGTEEITLPSDRVLHIPGLGFDGLRGYSPMTLHRQAVGLGLAGEEFGARFFGSGARPSGVLEFDGKFPDQASREAFREQFAAVQQGLGNAHRTAVLEAGMKWHQTSIPPNDAQFLETRQFQVREIARIFRVPPHLIGDLDNATFSNIEHQGLEFVVYTLRPWLVKWEQAINQSLIPANEQSTIFAEFLVDGLLRGDIASRYTAYATGRQNGWLSANDVRELENQNPLPGAQGDVYLVPLNMQNAEQFVEPTAAPPPASRSATETRSTASRQRTQNAHEPLLRAAATRVIRREVEATKRAVKLAFGTDGGGSVKFREWLDEFHRTHRGTIKRQMNPVLLTLATAVYAEATNEINGDEEMTPEIEEFVGDYSESLATRMSTSSVGQLGKIVAEAKPDEAAAAVAERLDEWEETRPGKVAMRESVQAGSAIAKAAWAAGGVTKLVWRASPGHCPICAEMDGKVAEITRSFLSPGDGINPEGTRLCMKAATAPSRQDKVHGRRSQIDGGSK